MITSNLSPAFSHEGSEDTVDTGYLTLLTYVFIVPVTATQKGNFIPITIACDFSLKRTPGPKCEAERPRC